MRILPPGSSLPHLPRLWHLLILPQPDFPLLPAAPIFGPGPRAPTQYPCPCPYRTAGLSLTLQHRPKPAAMLVPVRPLGQYYTGHGLDRLPQRRTPLVPPTGARGRGGAGRGSWAAEGGGTAPGRVRAVGVGAVAGWGIQRMLRDPCLRRGCDLGRGCIPSPGNP